MPLNNPRGVTQLKLLLFVVRGSSSCEPELQFQILSLRLKVLTWRTGVNFPIIDALDGANNGPKYSALAPKDNGK